MKQAACEMITFIKSCNVADSDPTGSTSFGRIRSTSGKVDPDSKKNRDKFTYKTTKII